jgi:putative N6-adenine-specific DNA methylase
VGDLTAPLGVENGTIVTNPPYGERMSHPVEVRELMDKFSSTLKKQFVGWNAWVLSGNRDQSAAMRLKATRRAPVWNGPIECRLLKYQIQ